MFFVSVLHNKKKGYKNMFQTQLLLEWVFNKVDINIFNVQVSTVYFDNLVSMLPLLISGTQRDKIVALLTRVLLLMP